MTQVKFRFTESVLEKLAIPAKRKRYFDTAIQGLVLDCYRKWK